MTSPSRRDRSTAPLLARRTFLAGAAAAVGGIGLAGCANPVTAGLTAGSISKDTVDFWNLFGGGDGARMIEMEKGFRKANRDLDLQAVTLAWGNPYYTKLSLATLGDKPPDVAVAHLTRAKTLVSSGLLQELTPELLAKYDLGAEKFNKTAWDAGKVDGKAYTFPIDTHPFVLYYNKTVCKKAGLLDAKGNLKPFEGAADFVSAMTKAKEAGGSYGLVYSIDNDTASNWRFFQTLYSQLKGQVLADEGAKVVLDDDKAGKVLQFMRDLTTKKLIPSSIDYQGAVALFAGGKAGFFAQGPWEITTFQTAKTNFGMTLFPNVFGGDGGYHVQGDSHTLVLPKRSGSDSQHEERAMRFVKSILEQSATWAQGGHIPAYLPYKDSAAFKKLTPQANYAAAADATVYDPPGWYSGSGSDFEIAMGSAIAAVVNGQLTSSAALHQMHSKLGILADTKSPL